METSPDFTNEVSQLEYFCQELGARVVIATKFHEEYASEGIEYSWGYSKALYCKYPLDSKKLKSKFWQAGFQVHFKRVHHKRSSEKVKYKIKS